jgi:hypothetical protein
MRTERDKRSGWDIRNFPIQEGMNTVITRFKQIEEVTALREALGSAQPFAFRFGLVEYPPPTRMHELSRRLSAVSQRLLGQFPD